MNKVSIRFRALKNGKQSIYLDFVENGKRKTKTTLFWLYTEPKTFAERAHNREHTMKAERERNTLTESIKKGGLFDYSVNQLCRLYRKENLNYLNKDEHRHKKNVDCVLDAFCTMFGEVKASQLKREHLRAFYKSLSPNAQTSTKRKYIAYIKAVLNHCFLNGYIDNNRAWLNISKELPKAPKTTNYRIITDSEEKQITDLYTGYHGKGAFNLRQTIRAFLFALNTGLRVGDLLSLSAKDIHTENSRKYVIIKQEKTNERLKIPLNQKALFWLNVEPYDKHIDLFFAPFAESDSITHRITRYNAVLAKVAKVLNVPHFSSHCARHTFASRLINANVNIFTIKELLGHTDIKTTMKYLTLKEGAKVEAVDII